MPCRTTVLQHGRLKECVNKSTYFIPASSERSERPFCTRHETLLSRVPLGLGPTARAGSRPPIAPS